MYVFDTSPFLLLFRSFYPSVFKSLWAAFDELVAEGKIVSTREVLREIEAGGQDALQIWAAKNAPVFPAPGAEEGTYLTKIFAVPHFQQNIEQQKLLKGGNHADAFVIAKAAVSGAAVVTLELHKPKAAKIPNICEHFKVPCLSLHEFMEAEGWEF